MANVGSSTQYDPASEHPIELFSEIQDSQAVANPIVVLPTFVNLVPLPSLPSTPLAMPQQVPRAMAQGTSQAQRRVEPRHSGVGQKLTHGDYGKILDYIDNRENFEALHGAGGKTRIGGKNQSKKTTFVAMAAVLKAHGFPDVSGENLGKRYNRYHEMYRKAVTVKQSSGGGLTEEEFSAGMTLTSKLEKMCPHFERMHEIFGMRSNVNPAAESSGGIRGTGITVARNTTEFPISESSESDDSNADAAGTTDCHPEVEDQVESPPENVEGNNQVDEAEEFEEVPTSTPHVQQRLGSSNAPNAAAAQGAATPNQQQQGTGANAKRKKKSTGPDGATSKGSLAALYHEKCLEKSKYRMELIGSKDQWKRAELEEMREARVQKCKLDRLTLAQSAKRQRLDHLQQLMLAQISLKSAVLTELVKQDKSEAQIERVMKFAEPTPMPTDLYETDDDLYEDE